MSMDDDLTKIAEQERVLVFHRFDMETAWELGSRLREAAKEQALPVAIDITLHSMPLFYVAMPGSVPDNARWIRRKRNVVFHFLRSSYGIGLKLSGQNSTLVEKFGLSDADYAAHGGSFPVTVEGAGCVGAVTVSGLPQRRDHNVVVSILAEMLGQDGRGLALSD